jgi:CheY-like chemotaxis protein
MKPFDGISVLLLEDEYLIALDAEQILTSLGTGKVAIVNTLDGASAAAADGGFDVAVLDLNINGQMSYPIAEALRQQGIPVVFATGYEMRSRQAAEFPDTIYVTKPYTREALRDAIVLTLEKNRPAAA